MALTEELKTELTNYVVRKFQELPDFTDDAQEVSEYIVLLISNGRSAEETHAEVKDLLSNEGLESVIKDTYNALAQYEASQQQQQEEQQQQQQQQLLTGQQQAEPEKIEAESNNAPSSNSGIGRSIPTKPASLASRIGKAGGISKRGSNGTPRNSAFRNTDSFQKALNLSNANGSETIVHSQLKKRMRCHQFPNCPNKRCFYAHPTKPCFQYPNCPNAPGTCNYLHPGEDDELIAELAKKKEEFIAQKNEKIISQFVQQNTGIALCKFGSQCSNQKCPFGHPTPANEDAKVITIEWCPENLSCANSQCTKAHSSLSKIKEVSKSGPQEVEKSLDACKFGQSCTNRYCKFRHARTATLCRDGESCTRIDCFFSHPIKEECRFGEGCKNPKCLFQHPNGKIAPGPIQNITWTKTNERQFAVPDEEVLEQAPPQDGGN